MFFYIFLIIASLLILKPIRNSLFLIKFGIEQLPYAYVLVAISAIAFIKIYSRYSGRIRLNILLRNSLFSFMGIVLVLWILLVFRYQEGWFLYVFFVWVAIFGVVATSQFWLLANYVFNAREAKRLFGFIGAGGISGGIFGGYFTRFMTPMVGTEHMVLFCILFWIICLFLLKRIWKESARYSFRESLKQEKRIRKESDKGSPLMTVLKSGHLTSLAAIVGLGALVASFVDYQYSYIATENFHSTDALTAFFGLWLSNLSFLSLIIQFFFTGKILKKFGILTSLNFLPAGISLGTVFLIFSPGIWAAVMLKVSEGSLKQSINKAGLELLYFPVSPSEKNRTKAFIDVTVDSFATGLGGILLIVSANYLNFSIQAISLMVLFMLAVWIFINIRARREYVNSFRQALERRSIDPEIENINLQDASIAENLISTLEGSGIRQVNYTLDLMEGTTDPRFLPALKKLMPHKDPKIRRRVLRILSSFGDSDLLPEMESFVEDPDHGVRIEALRYIFKWAPDLDQRINEYLNSQDLQQSSSILTALAREYRVNRNIQHLINIEEIVDEYIQRCAESSATDSSRDFLRANIASIIGMVNKESLNLLLMNLLRDDSPQVRRASIRSAGLIRHSMFLPTLFRFLLERDLRRYARDALTDYGEDAVDFLSGKITDKSLEDTVRITAIRSLSRIGSQNAVNVLLTHMNEENLSVRYHIIKALNKLRSSFGNLKFNPDLIERQIYREIDNFQKNLQALSMEQSIREMRRLNNAQNSDKENEAARDLLIRALEERLENNLERIFRLLGLKYRSRDIYNAYLGLVSSRTELKASAVEFLDNVLDAEMKDTLVSLVENYAFQPDLLLQRAAAENEKRTEFDILQDILQSDDQWLKILGLHLVGTQGDKRYTEIVERTRDHADFRVREVSRFALDRLQKQV